MDEKELDSILDGSGDSSGNGSSKKQRAAIYRFLLRNVDDKSERERRKQWVRDNCADKIAASYIISQKIGEAGSMALGLVRTKDSPPLKSI